VREGEHGGGGEDGGGGGAGEMEEAEEEEVLEEELLETGPDGVSPVTFDEAGGGVGLVEGVEAGGDEDGDGCGEESGGDDPEGAADAGETQAHGAGSVGEFEGEEGGAGYPEEGGDVEGTLPGAGAPDDDEDEEIADGEFDAVAQGGARGGGDACGGDRGCFDGHDR